MCLMVVSDGCCLFLQGCPLDPSCRTKAGLRETTALFEWGTPRDDNPKLYMGGLSKISLIQLVLSSYMRGDMVYRATPAGPLVRGG